MSEDNLELDEKEMETIVEPHLKAGKGFTEMIVQSKGTPRALIWIENPSQTRLLPGLIESIVGRYKNVEHLAISISSDTIFHDSNREALFIIKENKMGQRHYIVTLDRGKIVSQKAINPPEDGDFKIPRFIKEL